MIDALTLIAATVAAVGSCYRCFQNERSYALMKKMHRTAKKKRKKK